MEEGAKTGKYTLKKTHRKYKRKHGKRFSFVEMRKRLEAFAAEEGRSPSKMRKRLESEVNR